MQLLLLVVAAFFTFDFFFQNVAKDEAATYRSGLAAVQAQQWHTASLVLKPLAEKGYADAPASQRHASQQAAEFDRRYAAGQRALSAGQSWRAYQQFAAAREVERDYADVAAQQGAAAQTMGRFIYRGSDLASEQAGLYLVGLDAVSEQLPRSGISSLLYDIAPDGSRILYSVSVYYRSFFVRDPNGTQSWLVPYPFGSEDGNRSVTRVKAALLDRGNGVLLIRDGNFGRRDPLNNIEFGYYRLGQQMGGPALTADVVARPAYSDTTLFYAKSQRDRETKVYTSTIYSYDPARDSKVAIAEVWGQTIHLVATDSYVVYTTYAESELHVFISPKAGGKRREFRLLHPANPAAIEVVEGLNNNVLIYSTDSTGYSRAWLIDARRETIRSFDEYDLPEGTISGVSFSPDASKLLISGNNTTGQRATWLVVVDYRGKLLAQLTLDRQLLYNAGFLQDSRNIYYISAPRQSTGARSAVGTLLWDVQASPVNSTRLVATNQEPYAFDQPAAVNLTAAGDGLLYIHEGQAFISNLDGSNPHLLAATATAVWPSKGASRPDLPRALPVRD